MDSRYIDKPIRSREDDVFGFGEVAKLLAESISSPPNQFSITLGLEGTWGSGKSSILNLLQDEFSTLATQLKQTEIGVVNVSFSPWLITNRTALIKGFFTQINEAFDIATERLVQQGDGKKLPISQSLKKAKKLVSKFSNVTATVASIISAFDLSAIAAGTAATAKAIETYTADDEIGIETLKSELTELLDEVAKADPTFRILVTIDDLDRLEPAETLEVIRLVKAVADFPATFYLLSYDRNVISEAIQNSIKIKDGASYLEKIIQFSFKIPPLEPFKLSQWLQSELASQFKDEIDFGTHRAQIVFNWSERLLTTPRDVRRLLLSIQLIWPRLKGSADLLDFIWLQMVKEKASSTESDFYSWVGTYLRSLEASAMGGRVSGKIKVQKKLTKILIQLGWNKYVHDSKNPFDIDMHHLDQILVGITHSYLGQDKNNKSFWIYQTSEDKINKAIEDKRLSSPRHWRKYFALDFPSQAMTDNEWYSLVEASEESSCDLRDSIQALLDISEDDRADIVDQIVERSVFNIRSNSLPNPAYWLMAIAELSEFFENRSKPDSIFGFGTLYEQKSKQLAGEVISRSTGAKRKMLLKRVFDDFGGSSLVARLIRDQIYFQQKDGNWEENLYLKPTEIDSISKILAKKYLKLTPEALLESHDTKSILYAWYIVSGDYDNPKALINKSILTDQGLIDTLEALLSVSSSTHNGVPHLSVHLLKDFADTKSIRNRLEKLAKSNTNLTEQAAHILNVWDDSN